MFAKNKHNVCIIKGQHDVNFLFMDKQKEKEAKVAGFRRLVQVLNEQGIKTPDFQRRLGIQSQDWTNWRNRGIPAKEIIRVSGMLGLYPDWLAIGKGEKYKTKDDEQTNGVITPPKTLKSIFSGSNLTLPDSIQIVKMPFLSWSEFCRNTNSINNKKELDFMIIDNGITVSEEIYALDLDTNIFRRLPGGTRILIDPKKIPEKNNTVVLSIDDGIPTLVRWNPGLGLLQVEPLESGYPNSISLEGKNYTVLGVAVWQHAKGGALI